jgi:hypothetical protein
MLCQSQPDYSPLPAISENPIIKMNKTSSTLIPSTSTSKSSVQMAEELQQLCRSLSMKSLKENPFIKQDRTPDDSTAASSSAYRNCVQKAVVCRRQQATILSVNPFIQRDRSNNRQKSECSVQNQSRLPVRKLSISQPQNPFVSGNNCNRNDYKQQALAARRRSISTALYANPFIMADLSSSPLTAPSSPVKSSSNVKPQPNKKPAAIQIKRSSSTAELSPVIATHFLDCNSNMTQTEDEEQVRCVGVVDSDDYVVINEELVAIAEKRQHLLTEMRQLVSRDLSLIRGLYSNSRISPPAPVDGVC